MAEKDVKITRRKRVGIGRDLSNGGWAGVICAKELNHDGKKNK